MRPAILLAVLALGCLRVPAGPTVRPLAAAVSPARVAECRAVQHRHDTWSVTATVAGAAAGSSGGLGGILPAADSDARLGLGIGAGVAGLVAAIGTAEATAAASDYAALGCAAALAQDGGP